MSDLIKRLDRMAEVLIESPKFSSYCQLIYEASEELAADKAEIAGLEKEIADIEAGNRMFLKLLPSSEPTSCGYCQYEESDGSLIVQCPKCKAIDATAEKQSDAAIT